MTTHEPTPQEGELVSSVRRALEKKMEYWDKFATFKQRGEWVELQFMTEAARRQFGICKPWGDSRAYDVGIENGPTFLRVQVKSTTYKKGRGYWCGFRPNSSRNRYTVKQLDLFAAYVIPANAWYLIPAALFLGPRHIDGAMLSPIALPLKGNGFQYEHFREAWGLLTKNRKQLHGYRS